MSQENVIEVRDIEKKFKVYLDKGSQLKERLLFRSRNRYEERLVLKGISFDIKKGEAVGLIGQNGCGKSTTLKLLTRIMYPDSGTIDMKGRVSSLIELGAGFHPDMSGRENIYTNASIFGLKHKEIDERLGDIIRFSEMEKFLDNPVRTYSSGMYMRLAFSVAINVNADILLIDEILAVGDVNFQAKCFNKLKEIKSQGTTIVIVSHSLGQIEQICDRTIWLQDGLVKEEGPPREVHPIYMDFMGQRRQDVIEKENREKGNQEKKSQEKENQEKENQEKSSQVEEPKRWGNGKIRIDSVSLNNQKGETKQVFATGEALKISINYQVYETVENAVVGIGIFTNDGIYCYGTNTMIDRLDSFSITKPGTAEVYFDRVNLLNGEYLLDVAIETEDGTPVDYYKAASRFEMYSPVNDVGLFRIDHTWKVGDKYVVSQDNSIY